jgi:Tfp pilus assembly protein, pilus retraction ATPase PilT
MSQVSAPSFESHPLPHVDNYLEVGQKAGASDVHLGVAAPPIWRVDGTLQPMWPDAPVLTGEQTVALAETFMPEVYKEELNARGDSDFAYENEHARYRVSVVRQRLGVEIVFRVINTYVRTMDDLGLPEQLKLLLAIRTASSSPPVRWEPANQPRCRHGSANQYRTARSHHHARGPNRIRHPLKELSR